MANRIKKMTQDEARDVWLDITSIQCALIRAYPHHDDAPEPVRREMDQLNTLACKMHKFLKNSQA